MNWNYSVTMGDSAAPSQTERPPARSFDLFPTRIWQLSLNHLSAQWDAWTQAILAMRAAAPVPAGRTNRGGWNSVDNAVLQQPIFAELHRDVRHYCMQAFAEMGLGSPAFNVQSWVNIHDRGGFNFQHMHEGALLCGTFYLQAPEGSGALVFKDPRPGVLNAYAKGNGANAYKDIQLRPSAGLLVLFPHWLEHFVEPHANDAPRICIPFNALRP
ncbi:MAG TPA: TIGR02466 family protein [Dyella sp.]|nr:TIGR02466 family protein [Dyella sp.]